MPKSKEIKEFFDATVTLNSGKVISKNDQPCTPITLCEPAPLVPQENFKKQQTGCSSDKKEYDIIYVPAHQTFWLIPEDILEELNESSGSLYNALTNVTPVTAKNSTEEIKAARMRALSQSGLMKFFLAPDFSYFLSPESKQKYENWQRQIEGADQAKQDTLENYANEKFGYSGNEGEVYLFCISVQKVLASYAVEAISWSDKKLTNFNQRDYLAEAQKEARAKGYTVDQDGAIYTKEQIAISELLQKYVALRKKIEAKEVYSNRQDDSEAINIFEYLQRAKQYIDEDHWYTWYSTDAKYFNEQTDTSEYIYHICELARLGIAVPEFALTPANATVERGVQSMYRLTDLRKQREMVLKTLEEEFTKWMEALDFSGIAPPQQVFAPYMSALAEIDNKLEQMYRNAELNLAAMPTPRLLVWEPETFKPKQEDTLLQDAMPLREYVTASSPKAKVKKRVNLNGDRLFRQFSLLDLARNTLNKSTAFYQTIDDIKSDIKKLIPENKNKIIDKKISVANLSSGNDLFKVYLKDNGCEEIEIDTKWYKNNLFQYKEFFDYLKNEKSKYHIATLEDEQAKEKLGQEIQGILFQNTLFTRLMKFDHGAGAQLVRLIQATYQGDGGQPSIQEASIQSEMQGPTLKSPGISGNIGLTISFGRGTVSLGEIYFPLVNTDPAKYGIQPYDFKVDYKNVWDQAKTLDLGKLYLKISAMAAGFSGASFMLSGEAALYSDKTGLSLTTLDRTTGEAKKETISGPSVNGQASMFIGASASITGIAKAAWFPPQSVLTTFSEFYEQRDPSNINSYKTLAELKLVFGAMAGIGMEGQLSLSVVKGKLHLTAGTSLSLALGLKGSLNLEIDGACIWQFIHLINQAIKENDNNPLNFVTEEASSFITRYILVGMSGLLYIVTMGTEAVERIYNKVVSLGNKGSTSILAARIVENKDDPVMIKWFNDLPPRAFATLIYNLYRQFSGVTKYKVYTLAQTTFGGKDGYYTISDTGQQKYVSEDTALCDHQEAILICLQAIDARKERATYDLKDQATGEIIPNIAQSIFEEVILRLNTQGGFPFPLSAAEEQKFAMNQDPNRYAQSLDTQRLNSYCTNLASLNSFMAKRPSVFDQYAQQRYSNANKDYKKLVADLGRRMDSACQPGLTEVEKFLKGKALRLENLRGKTMNPFTALDTTRKTQP